MPLILALFSGLALWLLGEFLTFSLVAQAIGLSGAIFAMLATSLAGALLLHRIGAGARQDLFAMLGPRGEQPGWFAPDRLRAGVLASVGAMLLILPGFLTDSVGLLLVARAAQTRRPSGAKAPSKNDDVIELSPRDWRQLDETDHH
jgi:UPF0716 protein FxsA